MTKERANALLYQTPSGFRIVFNEKVELGMFDELVIESYAGLENYILTDAYILRKEKDAKEGEDIS